MLIKNLMMMMTVIYIYGLSQNTAHLKTNKVGLNDTSITNDINVHEI